MPYVVPDYEPSYLFHNGHINTIWSYWKRTIIPLHFHRHTLTTPDGDFLHLEEVKSNNTRCALLVHGLEGSAESTYITSLAKLLNERDWDIAALNLRGCSGVQNRVFKSYNSGSVEDLELVITYLLSKYKEITVIGFSLGGNIVLKYMGVKGKEVATSIKAAVGISVPCHLSDSSLKMQEWQNAIYSYRFVVSLKKKLRQKMDAFPNAVKETTFKNIKTIKDLDDAYTAPASGYMDAEDYYQKCSAVFTMDQISTPTLLINAFDDPFLSLSCFPKEIAEKHAFVHLYAPKYGGHVGFYPERGKSIWKHEEWILDFLETRFSILE